MYATRRPALIPGNVQLSAEDYRRIKDRTGRSPFPPPDIERQSSFGSPRDTMQCSSLYSDKEDMGLSYQAKREMDQDDLNHAGLQAHGEQEEKLGATAGKRNSVGKETHTQLPEGKRKLTTFTQREERRFSVNVPHTSELEAIDGKGLWQVSSPSFGQTEYFNPFSEVWLSSRIVTSPINIAQTTRPPARSLRISIPHSNETWRFSSIRAISPRDTSTPLIWGSR